MRPPKYRVKLTENEKTQLEQIIRRQTSPQNLARRAQIIVLANGQAKTNKSIAEQLGLNLCDVTRWTKRWIARASKPVEQRLSDAPRSGAPDRVTAEQWCQIIALACEPPEQYGHPITHWTHKELAKEVVKQGIVNSISASHVGTILKKKTCNPIGAVTG